MPEIFSYIKIRVDENRDQYGQYVLTGSQVFQLMQNVTESLAGRIAIFELFLISFEEIVSYERSTKCYDDELLIKRITKGFYPEFFKKNIELDSKLWFGSYVSTYLERDVRNLKQIHDLSRCQTFMQLLTARAGQLLNINDLSKECGISNTTVKNWLSVLESTYVIKLLRPYFKNQNKRYIKSLKIYFIDTGLLCYLLGIDPDRFLLIRERGHVFENMIVMEVIKRLSYQSGFSPVYFYRTSSGVEVDLIVENEGKVFAYEIKFSKTLSKDMAKGLPAFIKDKDVNIAQVLSLQEKKLPFSDRIQGVHWSHLLENI